MSAVHTPSLRSFERDGGSRDAELRGSSVASWVDLAAVGLSFWLASVQWNLSLYGRRDTLEQVVELHFSRTFFQPTIVKATDDESMMITHERVEHFVVVRFAICQVDGVVVSAKSARGRPELLFPPLTLDSSSRCTTCPRLERCDSERPMGPVCGDCERDVCKEHLVRFWVRALSAAKSLSFTIVTIRK